MYMARFVEVLAAIKDYALHAIMQLTSSYDMITPMLLV